MAKQKREGTVPKNKWAFTDYERPHTFIRFDSDTDQPSLYSLMQKLVQLRKSKRGKVRIGWLGDSMIEGDLLTATVRRQMQEAFGNSGGVGYVPITSVVANDRITVAAKWGSGWKEGSFRENPLGTPVYLSGHVFEAGNGTVTMKDRTVADADKQQILVKSLICGPANPCSIVVNGIGKQIAPTANFNHIVLDSSTNHSITIAINNNKLPVYGLSFEAPDGVVIDNFSFRGITGVELARLDSNMLRSIDDQRYYDLIILEYGANLMFRPNDTSYEWYRHKMEPVLKNLRRLMPHTDFLLISTADRAFRYGADWQTALGIDNLVSAQAQLAQENNMAFYNMYESMGGEGTITKWAAALPSLASPDHIHPNQRGADTLGRMLFNDLMKDFNKTNKQIRK